MALEDPDLALVQALQAGHSNEADAIELTQKTFVRAYFNIEKFRPTAKFVTWLYHIALNLCGEALDFVGGRLLLDNILLGGFDGLGFAGDWLFGDWFGWHGKKRHLPYRG